MSDSALHQVAAHEATLAFWRALREAAASLTPEQAALLRGALLGTVERVVALELVLDLERRSVGPEVSSATWAELSAAVGADRVVALRALLDPAAARLLDAYRNARRAAAPDARLVEAMRQVLATYNETVATR
jgi:hypothetical protein